jgi:ubiquinone biosynthesis accessory factor UbiK
MRQDGAAQGDVQMTRTRSRQGSGTGPQDQAADEAGRFDPPSQRGEARMVNVHTIDDLAQRLAALVPPGMKEAREDLATNFRSALQAGLRELDLVTREEFDVQRCVLLRTREKIEELEQQVANLERAIGATPTRPSH